MKIALWEIKEDSESGSAAAVPASPQRRRLTIAALVAVVSLIAALTTWLLRSQGKTEAPPPRVLPLTALPGSEQWPALSPDGNQVVFSWSGEKNDNEDLYLKFVGSSEMRRLTTDSLDDKFPRWSPDGRHIAFLRCQPDYRCGVRLISSMGGADFRVSDLRIIGGQIDWSPDGRFVVAAVTAAVTSQQTAGLYLLPVAGGAVRRLTIPKVSTDQAPAFSPDGHQLAYASCSASSFSDCDVYVLDLDRTFAPTGVPHRLTSQAVAIYGLTWSRNGQSIIYDTQAVPLLHYLWRVGVEGHSPPARIEVAGARAFAPATTVAADRLVFSRSLLDGDVYGMAWGQAPQPIALSSFYDFLPQFSPDGHQMVFCSERTGESIELWIASADGSGARQLTRGMGRLQCAGNWSPNGRQIALDSAGDDGRWHIWVIDPDGGTPRQVTADSGSQRAPTWSHDGQWIYYWRQQSDRHDIWRTRLSDGVKEQVTHTGTTVFGVESADGKRFLYQTASGALVEKPLAGGNERQLVKCAFGMGFAVRAQGIYYAGCEPDPDVPVYLLNPATGKQQVIGKLERAARGVPYCGLAVSPDGTRVLYTREVSNGADVMLIENFR